MLKENGFAALRTYEGGSEVSVCETNPAGSVTGIGHGLAGNGGRIHGHKILKFVLAVDPKRLAKRAKSMGWIHIPVMGGAETHAPVVAILVPVCTKIMAVAAFKVYKFAKNAFLNHPEAGHLKGIVAAVFQHHAVHAGAFCGVYKRPAFLYGNGGRHLQGNILAAFHGIDSNLGMELPGGGNIHKVNVRKFAEAFPAVWSNEFKCLGAAPVQERFLAIGHRLRIKVA
jgi:hypothetical protein